MSYLLKDKFSDLATIKGKIFFIMKHQFSRNRISEINTWESQEKQPFPRQIALWTLNYIPRIFGAELHLYRNLVNVTRTKRNSTFIVILFIFSVFQSILKLLLLLFSNKDISLQVPFACRNPM